MPLLKNAFGKTVPILLCALLGVSRLPVVAQRIPLRTRPAFALENANIPELQQVSEVLTALEKRIDALREKDKENRSRWSDAEAFAKAVEWAISYDAITKPAEIAKLLSFVKRGERRAKALEEGKPSWTNKKGYLTRGYVSAVDGSVQPYGLIIPESYDPTKPTRLDVVLHGSSRPVGVSELNFMSSFDDGDEGGRKATDRNYIELHPLGRVENCYRWAGETDVFEAIEDVRRCYNIDRERIVLRGMSMGASGTWHLGLKRPDYFVALGPYCGYVDTHQFSETPGMNFVKVGTLPDHQEKALRMLDSVDYAANAGVVPAIAAIGEVDPFFQAHVIMGGAMKREGLKMVNIISPGTAHVQDPATHKEQLRQIGEYADRGRNHLPRHLRFVTWTLKYSRCYWVEILGLEEHYRRAEIDATVDEAGAIILKKPLNITRFALIPPHEATPFRHVVIDGRAIDLPSKPSKSGKIVLEWQGSQWRVISERELIKRKEKKPTLQGPIDDAFTTPFLCVRGTGTAWSPTVQAWADANLHRFEYEWRRYFRGELPIINDTEVTAEDCQRYNLILFGDPGSNLWIRKSLSKSPVQWTQESVRVGAKTYPSPDYAPAFICPSPFAKSGSRYIVVNSGHTFHEAELNRLNYLLFPRLGDWAVFKVLGKQPHTPAEPLNEELMQAGYWNEKWQGR
ncbi:MAG: hypothetical protein NT023_14200 [Armatimonadetes bacterium]|nr:hypothetical protein [Armatimonadota bacterium]